MSETKTADSQIEEFPRAGLLRRWAALLYDTFLVAAIWMLLGFILQLFTGVTNNQLVDGQVVTNPVIDNILFTLMLLSCFGFYSWFWIRSGQTLGMLAWRIRVDSMSGGKLDIRQALIRFIAAWPAFFMLGLGYFWIYLDEQGDAAHDKLSGTKVVRLPKSYRPF